MPRRCSVEFRFPAVKLLDFADRIAELETSSNPFAIVILAHLKSLETRGDNSNRFAWKLRLVRGLYDRGMAANEVRQLFRFIDWLIDLPTALERQFSAQLHQFEEEKHMSYVTSVERLAREQGIEEGIEEGIEKGIEQGREQGICIGRIHLCQHRLGQPVTPMDQLFSLSISDLRRRAEELESELFASE